MDPAADGESARRAQLGRFRRSGTWATSGKKNALTPGLNKRWCIGKMTSDSLWHREDILDQYARPYAPWTPFICDDERPCQLLGAVLVPIPRQPGQPKRDAHAYARQGTCGVLRAFAPQTGFRYVPVQARRTIVDDAQFL